MRTIQGLVSLILTCGAAVPAQDVIMQMVSSRGASGSRCEPWSCTPAPLTVDVGGAVQIVIMGAPFSPHVLMVAGPRAQCVQVPGLMRSLILRPPIIAASLPLDWARLYVYGGNCGGWIGFARVTIPFGVPRGSSFLAQAIEAPLGGPMPAFSNAISITVR
jgi:hypothetical protein